MDETTCVTHEGEACSCEATAATAQKHWLFREVNMGQENEFALLVALMPAMTVTLFNLLGLL